MKKSKIFIIFGTIMVFSVAASILTYANANDNAEVPALAAETSSLGQISSDEPPYEIPSDILPFFDPHRYDNTEYELKMNPELKENPVLSNETLLRSLVLFDGDRQYNCTVKSDADSIQEDVDRITKEFYALTESQDNIGAVSYLDELIIKGDLAVYVLVPEEHKNLDLSSYPAYSYSYLESK